MAERALGDHNVRYDYDGQYQLLRDMVGMINKLTTLVNELRDDHATFITEQTAIGTTLADYKAIYDAHTHECSNSGATAARCSTPDTGGAENSLTASVASAFSDSSGSPPATITAAAADSGTFAGGDTPT